MSGKTKIKLIIAGGRDYDNIQEATNAVLDLKSDFEIEEIVDGYCTTGGDKIARQIAKQFKIPNKHFPAQWDKFGKSAGPIRNAEMSFYVGNKGVLLAFWDGKSKGTKNMIEVAKAAGIITRIVNY